MSQLSSLVLPQFTVQEGPGDINNGAVVGPLMTRNRAQKTADAQARYEDAVLRGRVFSGCTAATGVAPGTSISTTTPFSLYNPFASGVNLVVWEVWMAYVSGTLGAGFVAYTANTNQAAAATTGTAITAVCTLVGGPYAALGKPLTTATVAVTPTLVRPFCSIDASLASSVIGCTQVFDYVDGKIIVSPGCTLNMGATTGSGSTPLVIFGMTWEEKAL